MDYKGLFWGFLALTVGVGAVLALSMLAPEEGTGTYAGGGAFTNEGGGLATTSAYSLTGTSRQISATSSNRYHARVTIRDGDAWIRCQSDKPAARGTGVYVNATSTLVFMDSDNICTDGIQAIGDSSDGSATAEISWYELRY